MSDQIGIQASTKRRKSRQVSKQDGKQVTSPQHPTTDDPEVWCAYWQAQNQPWRTEPEIDLNRQTDLSQHRAIVPDIEKGIYPFSEMKLSRADLEWLLATHEHGQGPVIWSVEQQRQREGVDLRGVDLCGIDLSNLPLAHMRGGLTLEEWNAASEEQRKAATVLMEEANLNETRLEKANLRGAQLKGASLVRSHLDHAKLWEAQLEGANLFSAYLVGTSFRAARLKGANLRSARLRGANLLGANLEGTNFQYTWVELAYLGEAVLSDKDGVGPQLADVRWGDTNLNIVDWSSIKTLGDEYQAQQKNASNGEKKNTMQRLGEYQTAVRANRQLAVALQNQGLNEDAARFAFRAQVLHRKVLWYQIFSKQEQQTKDKQRDITLRERLVDIGQRVRKFESYLFWWFLDLLAGYGYRPGRTLSWYLLVIWGFAIAYSVLGHLPLLPDTLVFSLMSFHGRGFFPSLSGETALHNPLVVLAAAEAVVGLLIEISFIATFTQRFFGK